MKRYFLIFSLFIFTNVGHAHWDIEFPSMTVPDSLVHNKTGSIVVRYYINNSGKIISWSIASIAVYMGPPNKINRQFYKGLKWVYRERGYKFITWDNEKEAIVGEKKYEYPFEYKNTRLGVEMAKRLSPWIAEYVRQTRVIILDSAAVKNGKKSKLEEIGSRSYSIDFIHRVRD